MDNNIISKQSEVTDVFDSHELWLEALRQDIPWKQWKHWIKEKIMDHLKIKEDANDTNENDSQS